MNIRNYTPLLASVMLLLSCKSKQNAAVTDAENLKKEIAAIKPGTVGTSTGGWTMTAKINGKDWTATYFYPPEVAGRISAGDNDVNIGLPYDRRGMVVGSKENISKGNAVDLFLPEAEGGILGGYEGETEITKVDGNWVEGKFHFKATSLNGKSAEVTDGFFRIDPSYMAKK